MDLSKCNIATISD